MVRNRECLACCKGTPEARQGHIAFRKERPRSIAKIDVVVPIGSLKRTFVSVNRCEMARLMVAIGQSSVLGPYIRDARAQALRKRPDRGVTVVRHCIKVQA